MTKEKITLKTHPPVHKELKEKEPENCPFRTYRQEHKGVKLWACLFCAQKCKD